MNNFPHVTHFAKVNFAGVSYMKSVLAVFNKEVNKEVNMGSITMSVLKTIARDAYGSLPLFRSNKGSNEVHAFQIWFNDFAETNNIAFTVHTTGIWSEETQEAFDLIVNQYYAKK